LIWYHLPARKVTALLLICYHSSITARRDTALGRPYIGDSYSPPQVRTLLSATTHRVLILLRSFNSSTYLIW
jgi:hypothetical protein